MKTSLKILTMPTGIRRICALVGTAILVSVLSQHTSAAEIKMMSAEQIEIALFHKTRGISFVRPVKKGPADLNAVTFEFNSAELTVMAREQLDQLARVLTKPIYQDQAFIVSGHTDAVGKSMYNKLLSERRAQAVVKYLVKNFSIDRQRVTPVGLGESQMLPNVDSQDPTQRRARIEVRGRRQ